VYLALAVGYFQSMPNPSEIPRRKARAVIQGRNDR
jgi:hypothetical protein